jgi:hypothetical protein
MPYSSHNGGAIIPTVEQAMGCMRVCQMLSNFYQPICLFRYDDTTGEVFILAGVNENIEVRVFRNGLWRFTDDEAEL